jgi:hypothetical protein
MPIARPTRGPFARGAFRSPLHSATVAAPLGLALGIGIIVCFTTGLVSHYAQTPQHWGFLSWPARPAWLYRVTQGVHVATGIALVPLLIAKLWIVYPRLFRWPPIQGAAHALERITLVPLVAGATFQIVSGLNNTAVWYPWAFTFRDAHFWTAWITVAALIVHVAAKRALIRRGLKRSPARHQRDDGGLTRRGLLTAAGTASGLLTLLTVGQTVRPLKGLALLAPRRPDIGPQGVPVNHSAIGRNVIAAAMDPAWRLRVEGNVRRPLELSVQDLRAMPQHEANLPITCVEGWSAGGHWRGVRLRDLITAAGGNPDDSEVVVHSLQRRGSYRHSRVNAPHVRDRDTLIALELNGAPLHIDHGFPCRLIAPNRPGVQQTKWLERVVIV